MAIISKTYIFDAGHRLMYHKGKCANLHGHTYKVEIHLEDEIDKKTNMVADFADLNAPVREIIEKLDHAMIVNKDDVGLVNYLHIKGFKFYALDGDPTAELIGLHFFKALREEGLKINKVIVWETPKCKAEVTENDLRE